MAPNIDIMPPQVSFRIRDGQRYCCSSRCCRRIRRDCTRKPLRLTCNHKICTNRSVWESESIKKVIIGLKREKNEDQNIHFMKQQAKYFPFRAGFDFVDIFLQVFPTLELHWPSKKLLMLTTVQN